MTTIDLNCDLGESFGAYKMGNDDEILPFVSSINVACGFHAGDPSIMRQTVEKALEHNVAIGAHPGFPDLIGFGRRNMNVSASEVYDYVLYQTGALDAFVKAAGGKMRCKVATVPYIIWRLIRNCRCNCKGNLSYKSKSITLWISK